MTQAQRENVISFHARYTYTVTVLQDPEDSNNNDNNNDSNQNSGNNEQNGEGGE